MVRTPGPRSPGYAVYLGDLDSLLAPYPDGVSVFDLHRRLRLFWISLDRMFPDALTLTELGVQALEVV